MNKRQREAVYEKCILFQHAMDDAPASTPSSVTFGFVLRCTRGCETTRHFEIHPDTGEVTHSHYDHDYRYLEYRKSRGTQREVRLETVQERMKVRKARQRQQRQRRKAA